MTIFMEAILTIVNEMLDTLSFDGIFCARAVNYCSMGKT